jgi:nitrous oxidase accessory protein NosD
MKLPLLFLSALTAACFLCLARSSADVNDSAEQSLSAADYETIQAALDANPDRMIFVPAGDYLISTKIRIRGERSGLFGHGRIIQQDPNQPIIEIENARGAEIRDLTLTRSADAMETMNEGILAIKSDDLVIENVKVLDNRTRSAAIVLRECKGARISRCLVRNYMRVTIDDRTASEDWGYAFNCTDGTGISVGASTGTLIEGNRIVEDHFVPTPELKARYKLGDYVKKNETKGKIISQQAWDANYTDTWQQGSGIIVTSPEVSDLTRIIGNHVENAAQGIDLHCDHVVVSNNVVTNSFIGMKAMHGSRNVIITGNQFSRNSLWAIGLMPGTAAHEANSDGGSIVANNIISDFGHGDASWIWGNDRAALRFDSGQEADDPPLTDVLIHGNLIHNMVVPRYQYAVLIDGAAGRPRGLHFSSNLFPAGHGGVCNIDLPQ